MDAGDGNDASARPWLTIRRAAAWRQTNAPLRLVSRVCIQVSRSSVQEAHAVAGAGIIHEHVHAAQLVRERVDGGGGSAEIGRVQAPPTAWRPNPRTSSAVASAPC